MPIFELTVGQGRHALKCIWFNGTYLDGKFHAGQTVAVYGKVEPSRSTSNLKMIQPQFEMLPDASDDAETRLLEVGRITPVYESLGGSRLASRWQRKVIFHLLEAMRGAVPECLPHAMLARLDLPDREAALREVHFPPEGTPLTAVASLPPRPPTGASSSKSCSSSNWASNSSAAACANAPASRFATSDKVREAIREVLPFHPTAAQKRTLGEIVDGHAPAQPHAPAAAGRRGLGQDHRRVCRPCWWPWKTATRPR